MKENKIRQLAAVMFSDIVGYTAVMQKNEAAAIKLRKKHRKVFEEQHKIHHGDIIQYYGDGTLSVFKSAVEAVKCAIEIQLLLQEKDAVPLRIGLHIGDIVYSNTEVYGDGVNLASRIESMGIAGAILLSGKLNDELKNHLSITSSSLGLFKLKNITDPIEIFSITNKGVVVPKPSDLKGKIFEDNKTIAVLPFVNMSTSVENEYFSDGITEEIINALAKIKNLKVTSRTSSFFFKNKNIPIKQIGKELRVHTILEGSVRISGDILRITAQLIHAKEDFHFWSETWDRKLDNIFEIQDEISLLIADKLREQFGHFEIQDHLVEKQTDNIDAYEYSLKAKYYVNKWNPNDVKIAISLYEKALKLDPNHTESHIGLAEAYSFMGTTGFLPFEEAWGKTIQFTNRAKELNNNLSGVHYQLANQAFFIACDYSTSLIEMKKAIKINPNNAEAQQFMSFLYILAGEQKKSRKHLDIATDINPLSEETQFFNAYYYYMTEAYAKSLDLIDKCLEVNNKNIPAHAIKLICLLKLGRYDEVINYFETMPSDIIILGEKTGAIGMAYALKKDIKNATIYLEQLLEQASGPNGFTADSFLFIMYVIMDELDKAFDWVAKAIEKKSSLLLLRFADPLVNSIKNEPKYIEFQKILFPKEKEDSDKLKKKALLNEATITGYSSRLLDFIDSDKPYLDSSLSLRSLANKIDIHPNQLSWLLNQSIGKSFSEFINHYRIETFKKIALDPQNAHISLIALAYESGFNSKTVFNTYFKKETGVTPKQFLSQQV